MPDTVHDFTCFVIEDVSFSPERIGKDVILANGDDIQSRGHCIGLPDQRTVFRIQAPDKPVLRVFIRTVVSTYINASVAGTERAFGCDIVFVGQPENVPCPGIQAGSDSIIFDG